MATLTATPVPGTGAVRLTIDAGTDTVRSILRADANGTRPVRVQPAALPRSGTFTLTDWEPALAGPVMYRLSTDAKAGGSVFLDAVGGVLPRFLAPAQPVYSLEVGTVHHYEADRAGRSTVHPGINRTAPLVVLGALEPRTGTLAAAFDTYTEARELETLFEAGQTMMYRQAENPGQDMYFIASSVRSVPEDGAWTVEIAYVEVAFPSSPLPSSSWSFGALAATGTSFDAVVGAFRSFRALAVGT